MTCPVHIQGLASVISIVVPRNIDGLKICRSQNQTPKIYQTLQSCILAAGYHTSQPWQQVPWATPTRHTIRTIAYSLPKYRKRFVTKSSTSPCLRRRSCSCRRVLDFRATAAKRLELSMASYQPPLFAHVSVSTTRLAIFYLVTT